MTRPRTTEDLEELQLRARMRLERRRKGMHSSPANTAACPSCAALHREAAAVVAALDARLDEREENMSMAAEGDAH